MASEPRFYVLKHDFEGPHDTTAVDADGTETCDAPQPRRGC